MPGKDEIMAARLLEEYVAAMERGEKPDVGALIQRCPDSEREGLRQAIKGTDFLSENWGEMLAPPRVIEEGLNRIKKLEERGRLLERARARLDEGPVGGPLAGDSIVAFLSRIMGGEPHRPATAPVTSAAGVMFRGVSAKSLPKGLVGDGSRRVLTEAAARQARRLWLRLGSPAPPIDPRSVADELQVFLVERNTEGGDGCIVIQGDVAGILVNRSVTPEGRKRFTIAHELGHYELHRNWLRFKVESLREIECSWVSQNELEANAFASELLMPRDLVSQEVAHQRPSFAAVDAIVERYIVSITAAARRLVELSDYGCAVLCISDGVVRWFAKSDQFPYRLRTAGRPPANSDATSLLNGDETDDRPWLTDLEWWTEGQSGGGEAQVWEHSRLLHDAYVLTLLCLEEE